MQELLKILEDFIKSNFNEDTIKVFRQLWGKSNVSEFDIAEDLKLSINYVRNLLYGLHARNLVGSTRKKDRQKGWYIYYWTFNLKHAVDVLINEKKERIMELERRLSRGSEERYKCRDGHVEFSAVKALEQGFKCPECEQVLVRETSKHNVDEINAEIDGLRREIEVLGLPIEMPKEERLKKRIRVKRKAKVRKARRKLKKIKKRIKSLKKRLKKAEPERKKRIIKKIKKLKKKKREIKKKLIKKAGKGLGKKGLNRDKGDLAKREKTASKKEDLTKEKRKKGLLSLIKRRVGF